LSASAEVCTFSNVLPLPNTNLTVANRSLDSNFRRYSRWEGVASRGWRFEDQRWN